MHVPKEMMPTQKSTPQAPSQDGPAGGDGDDRVTCVSTSETLSTNETSFGAASELRAGGSTPGSVTPSTEANAESVASSINLRAEEGARGAGRAARNKLRQATNAVGSFPCTLHGARSMQTVTQIK